MNIYYGFYWRFNANPYVYVSADWGTILYQNTSTVLVELFVGSPNENNRYLPYGSLTNRIDPFYATALVRAEAWLQKYRIK